MLSTPKSTATAVGVGSSSLIAAAFGGATPADAQTGVTNWSGMYFGLSGGFVGMTTRMNDSTVAEGLNLIQRQIGGFTYGYASGGSSGSDAKLGGNGGTAGIHGGYNLQFGRMIVGAEADISWVSAKTSGSGIIRAANGYAGYANTTSFGSKINALATIRGRLGLDLNGSTMVYATAGFATANVKSYWSGQLASPGYGYGTPFSAGGSKSGWKSGYVIGGGVEHKLTDRVMIKAELDWVSLGGQNLKTFDQIVETWGGGNVNTFGAPGQVRFSGQELVIGKVGLSYKF